jgi:hypothetical protein
MEEPVFRQHVLGAGAVTLSVTQSTGVPGQVLGTIPFVLSSAPTPGDILVAFCAYTIQGVARTTTPPNGSWQLIDSATEFNPALDTYWYVVQPGDSADQTFTVNGSSASVISGEMYEVTGADTSAAVNQHSVKIESSATGTDSTNPVTPSVLGCLGLSGMIGDWADFTVNSVSSGWNLDFSENQSDRCSFSAHLLALTADTSTPVSCTYNSTQTSSYMILEIVLIAPASAAPVTGPPAYTALMSAM